MTPPSQPSTPCGRPNMCSRMFRPMLICGDTGHSSAGLPEPGMRHQIAYALEDSRMSASPEAFTLNVPDAAIADLRERLARTRFPDQAPGAPWEYGTNVDYLRGLVEYWRTDFDWRAQEARLNAFPHFKVPLHD